MRSLIVLAVLAHSLLTPAPLAAADSLVGYVPADAVFTVRVNHPAQAIADLKGTAFGDAIFKGPLAQHLKETGRLGDIRARMTELNAHLGFDVMQVLKSLAQEEVVFFLTLGDNPQDPHTGLLMRGPEGTSSHAEMSRVLKTFVNAGELEALESGWKENTELRHFRNKEGKEFYVVNKEASTLIANKKEVVDAVAAVASGTTGSLITNANARETCEGFVEDAQIAAFLNVPAIFKAMEPALANVPPRAEPFVQLVKSVKGIAAAISLNENGIGGRYRVALDESKLPPIIKKWQLQPDTTSSLAAYLPANSVVGGMAINLHVGELVNAIMKEVPEEAAQRFKMQVTGMEAFFLGGRSLMKELLPAIGPDMALILTDLDETDNKPAELTFIMQLQNKNGKEILSNLVRSLYGMSQLAGGAKEAAKHSLAETDSAMILSTKQKDLNPAVIVAPKALVISSSLVTAKKVESWFTNPPADSLESFMPPFKGYFMGLNMKAFGSWMVKHSSLLAKDRAAQEGRPVADVEAEIDLLGTFFSQMSSFMAQGASGPNVFELSWELSM